MAVLSACMNAVCLDIPSQLNGRFGSMKETSDPVSKPNVSVLAELTLIPQSNVLFSHQRPT